MTLTISIDFETLSLKENATLLALGAVAIDPANGTIASEFYAAIDPRQQPGRDIDPGTVLWWLGQDKAAQTKLTDAVTAADTLAQADESVSDEQMTELYASAAHRIDHVAGGFIGWFEAVAKLAGVEPSKLEVWSNGAVDHGWLDSMLTYSGLKNPVPYYRQRDYRTLKALFPAVTADELDGFIAHHALWDAKYQAKHLVKLLQRVDATSATDALLLASLTEVLDEALYWRDECRGLSDAERTTGAGIPWAERAFALLQRTATPTDTTSTALSGEDADALAAQVDGQNAEQSAAEVLHG